jgi:hypothetical protein
MLSIITSAVQVLAALAVVSAIIWVIRRVHTHDAAGLALRFATAGLGLAVGIALCFVRYMPREDLVVFGLPAPLAICQREGGEWIDYVTGPIGMLFTGSLNVLAVAGLFHGAAYVVLWRRDRARGRLGEGA